MGIGTLTNPSFGGNASIEIDTVVRGTTSKRAGGAKDSILVVWAS
jgi:hypothetical protein